jgi:hypothetical protein
MVVILRMPIRGNTKKPRISAGLRASKTCCKSSRLYLPVPVRLDVCGLPTALSATLSVPVRVPVAVGLNTTLMVHFALAARLDEQVVAEMLKSPVVDGEIPVKATACLLVNVNVFAGLDTPTFSVGNDALAGVSVACTVPVPDNATVCGLLGELSVIVSVPVRVPTAVGVKVTSILQFFPAASVAPQGLVDVVWPKSPLVVMLLIFSVEVPVLVKVTAFLAPVAPTTTLAHVRDDGVTVTVGPVPLVVTVRLTEVVAVRLPDVPVIVTLEVPAVAVALAVRVNLLVVLAGFGLKPAVTPLGSPEAASVTVLLNPFNGVMVIVLVPLLPCAIDTLVGDAESVKLGPEGPVSALIRPAPLGLPQPVARS